MCVLGKSFFDYLGESQPRIIGFPKRFLEKSMKWIYFDKALKILKIFGMNGDVETPEINEKGTISNRNRDRVIVSLFYTIVLMSLASVSGSMHGHYCVYKRKKELESIGYSYTNARRATLFKESDSDGDESSFENPDSSDEEGIELIDDIDEKIEN